MSGFVLFISEKLKSPSIITLDIGEGMDRISAVCLLIISMKASAGHEGGGGYMRIIIRAGVWILSMSKKE